jgi:hypothetical protein
MGCFITDEEYLTNHGTFCRKCGAVKLQDGWRSPVLVRRAFLTRKCVQGCYHKADF